MNVLTFGAGWADLFEDSLSRQLSKIRHLPLGDPKFRLSSTELEALRPGLDEAAKVDLLKRLNGPTRLASEVVQRLDWYIGSSDLLLIDVGVLDTAIGQHCLETARSLSKPVFGVGADGRSSPIAAAYLKGIVFPETADDLVRLVVDELSRHKKAK